jgi:hypothetical protein
MGGGVILTWWLSITLSLGLLIVEYNASVLLMQWLRRITPFAAR